MATDRHKIISSEKNSVELEFNEEVDFNAEKLFVDDSTLDGFTGDNQQEFNVSINQKVLPGFSFGRSGNVSNSWLQIVGGVPSNKTGIAVATSSAKITSVAVGNEDVSTFDVGVYEHDGNEINSTLLTTVSVVAKRTDVFVVSISVTQGKQLAARVASGTGKNVSVHLQLSGSV